MFKDEGDDVVDVGRKELKIRMLVLEISSREDFTCLSHQPTVAQ